MSFMDAAMDSYQVPTTNDLDIALPARREPKKDAEADGAAELRDLGQHGGAADGSPAASDTHGDVASGSDPEPQRDEPDDGEHTDSTEEQVSTREQRAAEQASEQAAEPEDTATVPEPEPAAEQAPSPEPPAAPVLPPVSVKQELAGIAGDKPRAFQKTGFSSGGVETVLVKRFPQPLVDRLRLSLAPVVGGEFAEAMSAPALITAFLIAKTGVELDVDANTAVAVDVFRQVDPRLLAVEDKIDYVMGGMTQLANSMDLSLRRIADTGNIADVLEFSMAYLVADRVAGLTTTDTNETNVDVAQKKVLVARESIRTRSKAQRKIEQEREGRRMK